LQLIIKVESPFLKSVEEIVYLKKVRDVSEAEALQKSIDYLNKRIKDINESSVSNLKTTYYGIELEDRFYNSGAY
jgi:hypothetical protein